MPGDVTPRDLGGVIVSTKLDALTTSAVNACGGATLGILLGPLACDYDPTKDVAELCAGAMGNVRAMALAPTRQRALACRKLRRSKAPPSRSPTLTQSRGSRTSTRSTPQAAACKGCRSCPISC